MLYQGYAPHGKKVLDGAFLEHIKVTSNTRVDEEYPAKSNSHLIAVLAIIPCWTQPYLDYLVDEKLPEDEVLSRQIIRRVKSYTVIS